MLHPLGAFQKSKKEGFALMDEGGHVAGFLVIIVLDILIFENMIVLWMLRA
jgi:hypothetical protein